MAPTSAEVKLVQLKNCFVNLPQPLVTILGNAEAVRNNPSMFVVSLLTALDCPKCRR